MPWRAGRSGNPRGRPPKGMTLSGLMRDMAEGVTASGVTHKQVVVAKIWEMAEGGDLAAARLVFEYVDGKPVERVEATIEPAVRFTGDDAAAALAELRAWEAAQAGGESGEVRRASAVTVGAGRETGRPTAGAR
jgi:hypothetical protein